MHTYLRHHGSIKKRKNAKGNRGCIPNRTPMKKRPEVANQRKRQGDIEVDLMMGKDHKPALIVMIDRKDRITSLIKITNKQAEVIADKIIKNLNKSTIYLK